MKYINNNFYFEANYPKYIISENYISRETSPPKSLKTKYEIMNDGKLKKKINLFELDEGSLQILTK